jgi:hypothetical protein
LVVARLQAETASLDDLQLTWVSESSSTAAPDQRPMASAG